MNWKKCFLKVITVLLISIIIIIVAVEYQHIKQEKIDMEIEIEKTLDELGDKTIELQIVDNKLQENVSRLLLAHDRLKESNSELDKLRSGNRYEMHDPTYIEVKDFIRQDKTEKIPYDDETFICADYASVVNNNAEDIGMRCCYIALNFEEDGHSLVGFNTIDKGMIFIEPQSDEWVKNLEVGNDYWTGCVIPESGYYYENDPDDTITGVFYFW